MFSQSLPSPNGSRKFGMESLQPLNLFSQLLQMPFADPCYFPARTPAAFAHSENCRDLPQGEAEDLGLPNKTESV